MPCEKKGQPIVQPSKIVIVKQGKAGCVTLPRSLTDGEKVHEGAGIQTSRVKNITGALLVQHQRRRQFDVHSRAVEGGELSRHLNCTTMLDDTSADMEGGIEINLTPVGEMTDQDCEGIVMRISETWWVACLDERCNVFRYGCPCGAVSSHWNWAGKGDTGAESSSLAFFSHVYVPKE